MGMKELFIYQEKNKMNDPIITYNRNELYREIELFANGVKIGEAEIEVKGGDAISFIHL